MRGINHITPDERKVVTELCDLCNRLGWTDKRFHHEFLSAYSYSSWIRIRHDDGKTNGYAGDTRKVMQAYTRALEVARMALVDDASGTPHIKDEVFHETEDISAVLAAIQMASKRTDEKRLVMYVAPPGNGKTALCRLLQRKYGALYTCATQSWFKSYCSGLLAIGKLVGMTERFRSTLYLENAVFQALRKRGKTILAIDDANTFGPHTCNMVRDICNHTHLTVVTLGTRMPFDQLARKGFKEAEQMQRRAVAIVTARAIAPSEVAPFFSALNLNGSSDPAFKLVASVANRFNRFDFIKSVAANLELRRGTEPVSLEDVDRAVKVEQKKLSLV